MPWQPLARFQTDIAEFAGDVMPQETQNTRKLFINEKSNAATEMKTMLDTLEWKYRRSHSNSHHSTPCTTEIKTKACFID
jgi:hypothetical protein